MHVYYIYIHTHTHIKWQNKSTCRYRVWKKNIPENQFIKILMRCVFCFENKIFQFSNMVTRTCSLWEMIFRHHVLLKFLEVFIELRRIKSIWTWYAVTWCIKMSSCFTFQSLTVIKSVLLSIKYNIFTEEHW